MLMGDNFCQFRHAAKRERRSINDVPANKINFFESCPAYTLHNTAILGISILCVVAECAEIIHGSF